MALLPFDYAARNAGRSPLRTILTTGGAAGVVFLVILMGAFVQTLGSTLVGTGDPKNAIVVGAGSEDFLEQSEIGFEVPTVLASSVEGVAQHHGQPMISPEIHHAAVVRFTREEVAKPAQVRMVLARGITPMAFLVHQQVFLRDGKIPGMNEVLAGKLAARKLGVSEEMLATGRTIFFEGKEWKISGIFEAPGTTYESELWVPLEDLKIQTKRETLTCAVVRLANPETFSELDVFTKTRLDLELGAVSEAKYYGSLARFFRPIQAMGWVMALLVIVSGLFGGLNTMMASINSRGREIACLETIGFSRGAVVLSLLQESVLQVGTGCLVAAGLAVILLSGRAVTFSMAVLALDVSGPVLLVGFAAGLFLALAGTLIPSLRLARTPLVELLRG